MSSKPDDTDYDERDKKRKDQNAPSKNLVRKVNPPENFFLLLAILVGDNNPAIQPGTVDAPPQNAPENITQETQDQPNETQTVIFDLPQISNESTLPEKAEPVKLSKQERRDIESDRESVRKSICKSISNVTENLLGTKYVFGGKDAQKDGGIDCSGFVAKAIAKAVKDAGGLLDENITASLKTHSDGQFAALAKRDLPVMRERELRRNIQGGMVILLDRGDKGWDRGRERGGDHIVVTTEHNGVVYVSESAGKVGVRWTPADEWFKKFPENKVKFYGVDLVDLADLKTNGQLTREITSDNRADFKINYDDINPERKYGLNENGLSPTVRTG